MVSSDWKNPWPKSWPARSNSYVFRMPFLHILAPLSLCKYFYSIPSFPHYGYHLSIQLPPYSHRLWWSVFGFTLYPLDPIHDFLDQHTSICFLYRFQSCMICFDHFSNWHSLPCHAGCFISLPVALLSSGYSISLVSDYLLIRPCWILPSGAKYPFHVGSSDSW